MVVDAVRIVEKKSINFKKIVTKCFERSEVKAKIFHSRPRVCLQLCAGWGRWICRWISAIYDPTPACGAMRDECLCQSRLRARGLIPPTCRLAAPSHQTKHISNQSSVATCSPLFSSFYLHSNSSFQSVIELLYGPELIGIFGGCIKIRKQEGWN